MDHVTVPVPEEHVDEFRQAMLRITLGQVGWGTVDVRQILPLLDERAVAVLSEVARSGIDDTSVPFRDVASEVGLDAGSLLDVVTEVNVVFHRQGVPMPLITESRVEERDGTEVIVPTLAMVSMAAAMVLDAVRAPSSAEDLTSP